MATTSDDKSVAIWDAGSRERLQSLTGHQQGTHGVAFSADALHLASGDAGGVVKIWQVASGILNQSVQASDRTIWRLAYSPDGRRVAAASLGVSIIDPNNQQPLNNTARLDVYDLDGKLTNRWPETK